MAEGPILAAVDGRRNDAHVLEIAAAEAVKADCELVALHVIVIAWDRALEDADEDLVLENGKILERAAAIVKKHPHTSYRGLCLQSRSAGGAIVEAAVDLDARLVVMGCRRLLDDEVLDIGAAASFVLPNAPCPVLLWRNPS